MKRQILTLGIICLFISLSQAQENKVSSSSDQKEKIIVKLKEKIDATVFINGKKYDNDILPFIDETKIESIQVLKGESALKKYGVDRVILITTKKITDHNMEVETDNQMVQNDSASKAMGILNFSSKSGLNSAEDPLIIIDDKKADAKDLQKLSPNDIDNIKVFKNAEAQKKYNTKKGVIIVTTKKNK